MYPVQVRLNQAYLKELANGENTYVYCKELSRHIVIDPSGLSDIKAAIRITLYAGLNKYDKTLGGIFLGYSNLKLIRNKGLVFYDDSFIHLEITADFYVFTPEVGSILTGVVTKTSENHIGCLVHKVFNVSVVNATEQEDWPGCTVQVGQEIKFEITVLEMNGPLPYIRGKFREIPFSVKTSPQNQNLQKEEKEVKKKKKKKLELEVNIEDYSTEYKNKRKKSTSETLEVQNDADWHGGVPIFDDSANPMTLMSSSDVKKKRKKSQCDTDDFEHPHKQNKRKTEKMTFPEEPELTHENQPDSLCTDNTSVLRTTHHDEVSSGTEVARNFAMTSTSKKHRKKLTLSTVLHTDPANSSSKENKVTTCESADTVTRHPSPNKKKKSEKLSPVPVPSCSKESTHSGIEYNFEVNCTAFASSTKNKKKKEKQQIDLSSKASQSQNKFNVIVEGNLEQASNTDVSSARKNMDKELFAVEMPNVSPTSFKSNGNVNKSFEEEKTVSLPLPFKNKKKKKKEKFVSEPVEEEKNKESFDAKTLPVVEETVTEKNVEGLEGVFHLSPSKKRKRSKKKLATEEKLEETAAVSLLLTKSYENNEQMDEGSHIESVDPVAAFSVNSTQVEENEKLINANSSSTKKSKHSKVIESMEHQTIDKLVKSGSVNYDKMSHLSPKKKKKKRKIKTAEEDISSEVPISKIRANTRAEEKHETTDAAQILAEKYYENNEIVRANLKQSEGLVFSFSHGSINAPVKENIEHIKAKKLSRKKSKLSKAIESMAQQIIDEPEIMDDEVSHLSHKKSKNKKNKKAEDKLGYHVAALLSPKKGFQKDKEINEGDLDEPKSSVLVFPENSAVIKENVEHIKHNKVSSKKSKHNKFKSIGNVKEQLIDELESDSVKKDSVGAKENADRNIADISLQLRGSIVSGVSPASKKKRKNENCLLCHYLQSKL